MHRCFIVSPDNRKPAAGEQPEAAAPLLPLNARASVLARHGARVLDPDTVATADEWPAPQSTVYRAHTLLLPPDLHEGPALSALNEVLAGSGMRLVSAPATSEAARSAYARSPRAAALVPVSRDGLSSPAAVDAWQALTALRVAARGTGKVDEKDVQRISLEHVVAGAAITGEPVIFFGAVGEPVIFFGGVDDSYMFGKGSARVPLEVAMPAPARMPGNQWAQRHGRRPVIAVLDTGVRAHPWLDVTVGADGGDPSKRDGYATEADGFVQVDQGIQDLLYEHGHASTLAGDKPRCLTRYPWDAQDPSEETIRPTDSHLGHGTFIAGLIRQAVPDATVLSIRIMQSDGIVNEGDLLFALRIIADRVAAAQRDGDASLMIDVVSLSLGYFNDSAADVAYSSALKNVIDELLDMGVFVVAAAGNYTTKRRYYPAAFAGSPPVPGRIPLLSVGALNPNGTFAAFSDGGPWVHGWAPGAAVASAFPLDVNGPANPPVADGQFQGLDQDDFSGGFAAWSGTSFAAPIMAGRLVEAMIKPRPGPAADPMPRLDEVGADAAIKRAQLALRELQIPG